MQNWPKDITKKSKCSSVGYINPINEIMSQTQEIQVLITLEVDTSLSKEQIKQHFLEMEKLYTENVLISKSLAIEIKEESEIYGNF